MDFSLDSIDLPWGGDDEEEEPSGKKVIRLKEEKEKFKKKYEAEKERRSELSTKKQEAEKELNRVKDQLRSLRDRAVEDESEELEYDYRNISVENTLSILRKLESVVSPDEDLITVYSPEKVTEVQDFKGLKNAVSIEQEALLKNQESFAAFLDQQVFSVVLKTRPFSEGEWFLDRSFRMELLDFIEREKIWALVSAGETDIFREEGGEVEHLDQLSTRVDSQHSSGGFSQDRFERIRDEQINEHLDEVRERLDEFDEVLLLGEKDLCKELPGRYLGGFDPNRTPPEVFYNFQLMK
ncbi:MAG: Vms1/Ankzf1 family peptidyl-tRNA hydrolase [Candidatus Nanohaloarchaea archaeon]